MINEARRQRFEAVRVILGPLLGDSYSTHLQINDAMEPVLEVHGIGQVWLFGMMDEPVWAYELEVDPGTGGSWDVIKNASLDLPEMSDPYVVAQTIVAAVEADRQSIVSGAGVTG